MYYKTFVISPKGNGELIYMDGYHVTIRLQSGEFVKSFICDCTLEKVCFNLNPFNGFHENDTPVDECGDCVNCGMK